MKIDVEEIIRKKRVGFEKDIEKFRAKAGQLLIMHTRLKTLGLSCQVAPLEEWTLSHGITLTIQREELPLLREVFGPLEIGGKSVKSASEGTIYVHVHLKGYPDCGVKFQYVKTLSAEQKCRIQRVDSSYETLVCDSGS